MALIVLVWGFFEGFNYVVICDKINRRYPTTNEWLDYGAITCAIVCILFHPFSTSFWGIVEIITTVIAIVLHLKAVFVRRKKVAVHGRLTKNTLGHGGLHGVKVENGI